MPADKTLIRVDALGSLLRIVEKEDEGCIISILHGLKRMDLETAPEKIKEHFSSYGQVKAVLMWVSSVKRSGQRRVFPGRAFIVMACPESVQDALHEVGRHQVDGHQLSLAPFQHTSYKVKTLNRRLKPFNAGIVSA